MISMLLLGCGTVSFFAHPPAETPEEDSEPTNTTTDDTANDTNEDTETLPTDDSGSTEDTADTADSGEPPTTNWTPGEVTNIGYFTYIPGERSDIPQRILLGDVNGDGHLDLFYNSFVYEDLTNGVPLVPYKIHVRRGDGLGNFTDFDTWLSPDMTFGVPNGDVGDVNKDGFSDFVLGTEAGLTVAFGSATGFVVSAFAGTSASTLRLVDWNNDGNLDVVCQNRNNEYVVWTGDGAGTLTVAGSIAIPTRFTDIYTYPFAVGDMNGDGFPDIFTDTETDQTNPVVLFNDGAGGFAGSLNPNTKRLGSDYVFSPHAVETDGDGNVEILNYSVYDPALNDYAPEIWNSETDTPATELPLYWTPPYPLYFDNWATSDLNHDQLPDMVRLAQFFDGVQYQHRLLTSLATGTGFSAWAITPLTYTMLTSPWTDDDSLVTAGDVDEDGCIDIAVLTGDGFQLVHGGC